MPNSPPYVPVAGVATGADATATLLPTPWARKLAGLTVAAPTGSRILLYLGYVSPSSKIDQNGNGYNNTQDYASPRKIPAGLSVIALWPGLAAKASQCSATFVVEDDA